MWDWFGPIRLLHLPPIKHTGGTAMRLRWKILLGLLFVSGLFTLALFAAHLRAKHAVEAYRQQLRTRGEKLTVSELIPPVPTNGPNAAQSLISAANLLPRYPS